MATKSKIANTLAVHGQSEGEIINVFESIKEEAVVMMRGSQFRNQQAPIYTEMHYARLSVDKIGLSCPREYLNLTEADKHKADPFVNFIVSGGHYRIMVSTTV